MQPLFVEIFVSKEKWHLTDLYTYISMSNRGMHFYTHDIECHLCTLWRTTLPSFSKEMLREKLAQGHSAGTDNPLSNLVEYKAPRMKDLSGSHPNHLESLQKNWRFLRDSWPIFRACYRSREGSGKGVYSELAGFLLPAPWKISLLDLS